jgi:hypothetical protein
MNDSHITISGVPLEDGLAAEKSIEVARHLRAEISNLGSRCGLRRCPSAHSSRLGRQGRPKKAVSLLLLAELGAFLKDESYPLAGIADLFDLTMGKLQFYVRWFGIQRKRGRKSRKAEGRAA